MVELQFVLNAIFSVISAACLYFFSATQSHEKRIQKLEDVTGLKVDTLIKKVEEMEKVLAELSSTMHREKSHEHELTQTIRLLHKHLKEVEKEVENEK